MMSTLSLRLPESLHRKLRELADRDDVSINQFIATAVAEKAAALLTVEYLDERARRGDVKLFGRVMSRVPDIPPDPGDELPGHPRQANTRLQPTKARRRSGRKRRPSRPLRS
jgi:hypothetical protein